MAEETQQSRAKAERLRESVVSYLGEAPVPDVLALVDRHFIVGYGRYLFKEATREANLGGALDRFETLRRVARFAMRRGQLPIVDLYPEIEKGLLQEFGVASESAEKSSNTLSRPDFGDAFRRLLRAVATEGESLPASRKGILLYIIGLLSCGTDWDDLAALRRTSEGGIATPDGREIDTKGLLGTLLEQYNGKRYRGQHPIKAYEGASEADLAGITAQLRAQARKYGEEKGIGLPMSSSVKADWLSIAGDCGATTSEIADYVASERPAQELVERIGARVTDSYGALQRQWRALCSYERSVDADKMESRLRTLANSRDIGSIRCYNPHEIRVKKHNSGKIEKRQKPVVSRYLFVNSSDTTCAAIEARLRGASFVRRSDDRSRRAVISDGEIMRLMAFLNDYGDGMELVDMREWARGREEALKRGQAVKINKGPYAGYEGLIVDIKNDTDESGSMKTFLVRVAGLTDFALAAQVTARLRGLDLTPITT